MAKSEIIPADLYIKPPGPLKLRAKKEFVTFIRQFPPEYFLQCDAAIVQRYLTTLSRLDQVELELTSIDDYITENDMGTEAIHPLVRVHDLLLNQYFKLSGLLRIAPTVRSFGGLQLPGAEPVSNKRRLSFKFTGAKAPNRVSVDG